MGEKVEKHMIAFGNQQLHILEIHDLASYIAKLFQDRVNFPYLPRQDPPINPFNFEELDDLFDKTMKGGKNYRMALKSLKQRKIITVKSDLDKYRARFGCNDITQDHLLQARKSMHWRISPNDAFDYNSCRFPSPDHNYIRFSEIE